ncbi:MAG: tetraacyldisaccharide 4'-kinase [Gemmatimonadales bacterium]|nr:MAG: tetraacyldisaccharide 4'-kinase [Gemmatimonadales bacterium]
MRRLVEAPVRRWWHGDGRGGAVLGPLTAPFSLAFGIGVRARNFFYDRGLFRTELPPVAVISVGNLSVGGTGKTPVSRWLLERLRARGRRPALVSRGYGEDEILLHRRWNPDLPVVTAARRIEAVQEAVAKGADVCVVDDGFQHRALGRDLDLVLLSVEDPLPVRLLPRGPYREPLRSLRRAGLVLVTFHGRDREGEALEVIRRVARRRGCPRSMPFPFVPGPWQDLAGQPASPPAGNRPLLVSSVARPEAVAAMARRAGVTPSGALAFPDHHGYRPADLAEIRTAAGSGSVVTTEKDAVKLAPHAGELPPTRVLTLVPGPDRGVERIIDDVLDEALRRGDARRKGRRST